MNKEKTRIRGADSQDAIREWAKTNITESPSNAFALGKFFFGVSGTTIGALTGLLKLGEPAAIGVRFGISVLFLITSLVLALNIVLPRTWHLTGEVDLFDEHKKQVNRTVRWSWIWFASWIIGLAIGSYAVLKNQ